MKASNRPKPNPEQEYAVADKNFAETEKERKVVKIYGRVTMAVAEKKPDDQNWSEWVTDLTANYRRARFRSRADDPAARRYLAWTAVALDEIGRVVTGHAINPSVNGRPEIQKLVDAALIQRELARIRMALESWSGAPVTKSKGGPSDGIC